MAGVCGWNGAECVWQSCNTKRTHTRTYVHKFMIIIIHKEHIFIYLQILRVRSHTHAQCASAGLGFWLNYLLISMRVRNIFHLSIWNRPVKEEWKATGADTQRLLLIRRMRIGNLWFGFEYGTACDGSVFDYVRERLVNYWIINQNNGIWEIFFRFVNWDGNYFPIVFSFFFLVHSSFGKWNDALQSKVDTEFHISRNEN